MLFNDPRPLKHGRSGWNLFTAADEFFSTLRKAGHRGVALNWYVYDGQHFQQLLSFARARHELVYTEYGLDLGAESYDLWLRDLTHGAWCGAHVISLSIKHGLTPFRSEEQLTDAWVVTESLRNSASGIFAHVDEFIGSAVVFVGNQPSTEICREKWLCLGIPMGMLDQFVLVNPRWRHKQLEINEKVAGMPDRYDVIHSTIMFSCRWRQFCETRWGAKGECDRMHCVSFQCGIEGLVPLVVADKTILHTDIGGFRRLTPALKKYFSVGAISSFAAESILCSLLADDRLLMKVEHLKESLADEIAYIQNLSDYPYDCIAGCCGDDFNGTMLRDACSKVAITSAAYMNEHLFRQTETYPLSLAVGNVEENVDRLMADTTDIKEPTTRKIKRLLQEGD